MLTLKTVDHTYRMECDMLDVSSMHRADTSWRVVDAAGHEHRWHDADGPATHYSPERTYHVPTLVKVSDGSYWYDDDDAEHEQWHFECAGCRATVEPGYTADTTRQVIPGLRHYYIDDEPVTQPVFEAAIAWYRRDRL